METPFQILARKKNIRMEPPTKRQRMRSPLEGEEENLLANSGVPRYVDAWPTWVPPSLLQICYRTLRAAGRIQELEQDGRIPQETLEDFAKWTVMAPSYSVPQSNPWEDCAGWGFDPPCYKNTEEEGEADNSKVVAVFTRRLDGARACVNCMKYWMYDLEDAKTDGIGQRIHIDYEGNYKSVSENPRHVFNDWKGAWVLIVFVNSCNEFAITGYVPGKTTEDDLLKCGEALGRLPVTQYCWVKDGSLLLYDSKTGPLLPNDRGSPPALTYTYGVRL